jgi:hypothetical protein
MSDEGCPLCGKDEPHEHIISDPLPPGNHPSYEQLSANSMAAWCLEERAKGAGGCGACAICCGELRDELEKYINKPPTFAELDNLLGENEDLQEQIEKLKQCVRTAYFWAGKKETWQQTRDVLANQMLEMGEL